MDWKISLDRYLTTGPQDDFSPWCEDVCGIEMSDEFYNQNEAWVEDNKGQCDIWLNKLYDKEKPPKEAAAIIERAFRLYKLKK